MAWADESAEHAPRVCAIPGKGLAIRGPAQCQIRSNSLNQGELQFSISILPRPWHHASPADGSIFIQPRLSKLMQRPLRQYPFIAMWPRSAILYFTLRARAR